jgi:predicted membrane protein
MGNANAALFTFVVPFLISTVGGTIIAAIITLALHSRGVIGRLREEIE